jgi:hypothetical protein
MTYVGMHPMTLFRSEEQSMLSSLPGARSLRRRRRLVVGGWWKMAGCFVDTALRSGMRSPSRNPGAVSIAFALRGPVASGGTAGLAARDAGALILATIWAPWPSVIAADAIEKH